VASFNIVIALALIPAAFAGLAHTGALAWNGFLSFWVKNIAIALWIIVMSVVLAKALQRDVAVAGAAA
jgi:hypothetical protein